MHVFAHNQMEHTLKGYISAYAKHYYYYTLHLGVWGGLSRELGFGTEYKKKKYLFT